MPVALALYQPDIPQNTGTLMRLAACLGFDLHIIHPTGFPFSDAKLKRAGMDYADRANVIEHDSFAAFESWRKKSGKRLILLTTKGETSAYEFAFSDDDILLAGRESAGVPAEIAEQADAKLRIPMNEGLRSINVAIASALVMGEALRQTDGLPKT